jgi:hypothetical protein
MEEAEVEVARLCSEAATIYGRVLLYMFNSSKRKQDDIREPLYHALVSVPYLSIA